MGKKCKKKTQWRKLSLNENSSQSSSSENLNEEVCEELDLTKLPYNSEGQNPQFCHRRPFNPNFHRRPNFQPPYPPDRRPPFERGGSAERFQFPINRQGFRPPFQHSRGGRPPHYQFSDSRRSRPFKYFGGGRGGYFNPRGRSPYNDGFVRRWSHDEGLGLEDPHAVNKESERLENPQENVKDNEYTKIETPRQEVIFKKSSLDKRPQFLDDRLQHIIGDQYSIAGTTGDQSPQTITMADDEHYASSYVTEHPLEPPIIPPYDNTNSMFMMEPGKPPPVGVVMQQAYPGGPLIPIPVHWTPYIDPMLIPGEAALTTLDPQFTHVLPQEAIPMDPQTVLPVQYDANGCPINVQVKVDSAGNPVEISPSAFPFSLNTLDTYQQEMLLGRGAYDPSYHYYVDQSMNALPSPKESEDHNYDSQYATMSEVSTAPTTPSGELSDDSRASDPQKSPKRHIRSSSCYSTQTSPTSSETISRRHSDTISKRRSSVTCIDCERTNSSGENNNSSLLSKNPEEKSSFYEDPVQHCHSSTLTSIDASLSTNEPNNISSKKNETNAEKQSRISRKDSQDAQDEEELSKHQIKRNAKKLKKEKKKLNKDKQKSKSCTDSICSQEENASLNEDCLSSEVNNCPNKSSEDASVEVKNIEQANTPSESPVFSENSTNSLEHSEDNSEVSLDTPKENETTENFLTSFENKEKENSPLNQEAPVGLEGETIEENLVCKPGYIMVPILTPYYDPALLYNNYPIGMQDDLQQQQDINYIRRKKKKLKKRYYHETQPQLNLEAEMYTGDTYVTTPDGYMVSVQDRSHLNSAADYHYMQNVCNYQQHHLSADEGFSSVENSPHVPESGIYEQPSYQHNHRKVPFDHTRSGSKFILHVEERKEIIEVLEQLPKMEPVLESADSGVSESEELNRKQDKSKNENALKEKSKKKNEKNVMKEKKANKSSKKNKKNISKATTSESVVVIQEPDFNDKLYFSTPSVIASVNPAEETAAVIHKETNLKAKSKKSKKKQYKNKKMKSQETNNVKETGDNEPSIDNTIENISEDEEKPKRKKKKKKKVKKNDTSDIVSQSSFDTNSISESVDLSSELSQSQEDLCSMEESGNSSPVDLCINKEVKLVEKLHVVNTEVTQSGYLISYTEDPSQDKKEIEKCKNDLKDKLPVEIPEEETKDDSIEEVIASKSLCDLGVTDAVKKWIQQTTPEKIFVLSEAQKKSLSFLEIIKEFKEEEEENSDDEISDEEPAKNVRGNPSVGSLGKSGSSERVATLTSNSLEDLESTTSCTSSHLSRGRLFSSNSSSPVRPLDEFFSSSYPTEESNSSSTANRNYDPFNYSKYYELGAGKLRSPSSTCSSSRESTLEPSSGDDTDDTFQEEENICSETETTSCSSKKYCSNLSSGIGSSLASTPVTSPAHNKKSSKKQEKSCRVM